MFEKGNVLEDTETGLLLKVLGKGKNENQFKGVVLNPDAHWRHGDESDSWCMSYSGWKVNKVYNTVLAKALRGE